MPKDEQYTLNDDGEMELVPYQKHKLRPRGTYYAMQEYVGSDYPEFLLKVQALGMTIQNHSVEEMKRGLGEYLKLCEQYQKPITNQAMYTAMGLNKDIVYDITHGRTGSKEQKQIIVFAKQLAAMHREALGVSGAINPILAIFWSKAFDGLDETSEAMASASDSVDINTEDAEVIAEKYGQLPD